MLRQQQFHINALAVAVKALPEEEVRSVGGGLNDLKVGWKFLFTTWRIGASLEREDEPRKTEQMRADVKETLR